jgi:hypothetical protein
MITSNHRALRRGSLTAKPDVRKTAEAATTDFSSRAGVLHKTVNYKPNQGELSWL